GGVTTKTPASVNFPLAGTTGQLVITSLEPGIGANDIRARFVAANAGEANSVAFQPLDGPKGSLVFTIAPNTAASVIRDLLNNNPTLSTRFRATVAAADVAKQPASFVPPNTNGGTDNSALASGIVGKLNFTERTPNS